MKITKKDIVRITYDNAAEYLPFIDNDNPYKKFVEAMAEGKRVFCRSVDIGNGGYVFDSEEQDYSIEEKIPVPIVKLTVEDIMKGNVWVKDPEGDYHHQIVGFNISSNRIAFGSSSVKLSALSGDGYWLYSKDFGKTWNKFNQISF